MKKSEKVASRAIEEAANLPIAAMVIAPAIMVIWGGGLPGRIAGGALLLAGIGAVYSWRMFRLWCRQFGRPLCVEAELVDNTWQLTVWLEPQWPQHGTTARLYQVIEAGRQSTRKPLGEEFHLVGQPADDSVKLNTSVHKWRLDRGHLELQLRPTGLDRQGWRISLERVCQA